MKIDGDRFMRIVGFVLGSAALLGVGFIAIQLLLLAWRQVFSGMVAEIVSELFVWFPIALGIVAAVLAISGLLYAFAPKTWFEEKKDKQ